MPYLTEERKNQIAAGARLSTLGDLTYAFTLCCIQEQPSEWSYYFDGVLKEWFEAYPAPSFANYAGILGCLTATQLEWFRRQQDMHGYAKIQRYIYRFYSEHVAPYEDEKIKVNGDVYDV